MTIPAKQNVYAYLKASDGWKELGDNILKKLNEIFKDDIPNFDDFTIIAEHYNLVKNNFLEIAKTEPNTETAILLFAATLHALGTKIMKQCSQNNDDNYKMTAIKCYQLSINLNPFLITSYMSLAIIYGTFNNDVNQAIHYCDVGVDMSKKIQKNILQHPQGYYHELLSSKKMVDELIQLRNDLLKRTHS